MIVNQKNPIQGKRRARKLALQALYQWALSGTDLIEIEAQYRANTNMDKVDGEYFARLLHEIPRQLTTIQDALLVFLDRPLVQVSPIELTILRICGYELLFCPELPYKVILDESVMLNREFGSEDGHRYVNGVLNQLAKKVRTIEIQNSKS